MNIKRKTRKKRNDEKEGTIKEKGNLGRWRERNSRIGKKSRFK